MRVGRPRLGLDTSSLWSWTRPGRLWRNRSPLKCEIPGATGACLAAHWQARRGVLLCSEHVGAVRRCRLLTLRMWRPCRFVAEMRYASCRFHRRNGWPRDAGEFIIRIEGENFSRPWRRGLPVSHALRIVHNEPFIVHARFELQFCTGFCLSILGTLF